MNFSSIVIKNDFPLKAWKETVENFQDGVPLFIETDLNHLDIESPLFEKYSKSFAWHFRDSHRSMMVNMKRALTQYEFSYYDRMRSHFGFDQIERALEKPNNIICNWDAKYDWDHRPKPCFVTAKIIIEQKYLHLSVSFRTRDIIRRLYPNYIALMLLMQDCAKKSQKKVGKLFDYSNQIIAQDDDLHRIKSWKEFQEY